MDSGAQGESGLRHREVVAAGVGGLSVALDLPTRTGYDSGEVMARNEVSKAGAAINPIPDTQTLFQNPPPTKVSTSMMVKAPASTPILLYQPIAAEQGIAGSRLSDMILNDALEEAVARGTCFFALRRVLRHGVNGRRTSKPWSWQAVEERGGAITEPYEPLRAASRSDTFRTQRDVCGAQVTTAIF
ncbi:methylmalonyl-CoA mutase family protein [Streptomyces fuscichromogenes]|uniref:Methylmalonyl-CoA mutase alpha/beta chain catalytic domain-containing protein n=1 Tax=Streptomyces fuscichromogenes TaxID=1324013 RepID=A0A917XFS7_9ACTN|nr:methylmalonyl-CoA mutase family protein [Streptomyces fuscichromogenes]GGN20220.1 hypothetical protein GCM10011578_050590 [Streptomyces fuscichromogenes]